MFFYAEILSAIVFRLFFLNRKKSSISSNLSLIHITMIIIDEVKLDYKDVLLRPKRSTLNSRKEVDLSREFHFPHSPKKWK
jgi:hypothetical protein